MIAPYYAIIYTKLDRIVQRRGWNMCLHGSLARDLDIVLIPWTDDADSIDIVVDDIRTFIEGKYVGACRKRNDKNRGATTNTGLNHYCVEDKPHGRKAISIYIGVSGYYLDISIMPRIVKNDQ